MLPEAPVPDAVLLVGPLDRVLYFRTLPEMDRLSAAHLAAIAAHAREEFFPRGSTIVAPDEQVDTLYLVVDGQVSLRRSGRLEGDVGPGASVGLLHLLARTASGLEATAVTDTLTLRLDWDDHLDVCEEHFPIVEQYLWHLSDRMVERLQATPQLLSRPHAAPVLDVPPSRDLDVVERLLTLHATGVFPHRAPDALGELARHVHEVRVAAGETVWRRGDPAEDFLVVVNGAMGCSAGPSHDPVLVGPSGVAGLHEALGYNDRWCDAVATSPSTVLRIDVESLLDIMEDHFDMAIDFVALRAAETLQPA
jgi:CRP-like cAMP-binding protein